MKSKIIILLLVVALVCGFGYKPLHTYTVRVSTFDALKTKMTDTLRDPDSAHFRNLHLYHRDKSEFWELCGEVNAKNSMGGYVGYQKFYSVAVVSPSHKSVDQYYNQMDSEDEGEHSLFNDSYTSWCLGYKK